MKKAPTRFLLAIAITMVLVLSCYGLARAYLVYEADRAGRMLKELAAVKIGDDEAQVLSMLQRYGNCRGLLQPYTKVDKTDYECLVEIGPSGIYYLVDRANTSMFYRFTRAILSSLNPRLRRAVGLRRWSVCGRVGFKDKQATYRSSHFHLGAVVFNTRKQPGTHKSVATLQLSTSGQFERLLDSDEAAALLGIHKKTLQRMARSGEVPGVQIGDLWRFRASTLNDWLASRLAG
jgi:excisionase family DNA binding protein